MNKSSLIALSILNIAGSLMFSAEASIVKENEVDFQHFQTISNKQVFDRKAYYRAIARKHDDLTSFDIPDEEKFAVMFDLGKLYYDFAMNSKDLDEEEGYYEKAEFYLKKSNLPEAREYLVEIIKFNYDQN